MKKSKGRVLFLYPNSEGYGGVPNGLALLSACLRASGFETKCFDTTFTKSPPLTHYYRMKHGGVQKADEKDFWGTWTPELAEKIPDDFIKTIREFKPDLIAVSLVDVCYEYAIELLTYAKKEYTYLPVIAGGALPTLCPDLVIKNECIDVICIGEGEDALVEFAECVVNKENYGHIQNLWCQYPDHIKVNPLRPLKNMDELPAQDWSIFDERQYYKPYCGKFHRTGFFELARGCHYNCTYCCTAALRTLYHGLGSFVRQRSIDKTMDEIVEIKNKYKLELIFFIDDNFLGMPKERFDYFCEQYKKRVDLPFYIQTRSETIKEDYIKKLKKVNISTIAIGIETGNEEFRRVHMNRYMSDSDLKRVFDLIHKYEIRTTANIILGMPHEEEKMFIDTIKLLREIKPKSISINYFQPYRGNRMREEAVKLGLIPEDYQIKESNICLDLPKFRRKRLIHCYENFTKYLDGELNIDDFNVNASKVW